MAQFKITLTVDLPDDRGLRAEDQRRYAWDSFNHWLDLGREMHIESQFDHPDFWQGDEEQIAEFLKFGLLIIKDKKISGKVKRANEIPQSGTGGICRFISDPQYKPGYLLEKAIRRSN